MGGVEGWAGKGGGGQPGSLDWQRRKASQQCSTISCSCTAGHALPAPRHTCRSSRLRRSCSSNSSASRLMSAKGKLKCWGYGSGGGGEGRVAYKAHEETLAGLPFNWAVCWPGLDPLCLGRDPSAPPDRQGPSCGHSAGAPGEPREHLLCSTTLKRPTAALRLPSARRQPCARLPSPS